MWCVAVTSNNTSHFMHAERTSGMGGCLYNWNVLISHTMTQHRHVMIGGRGARSRLLGRDCLLPLWRGVWQVWGHRPHPTRCLAAPSPSSWRGAPPRGPTQLCGEGNNHNSHHRDHNHGDAMRKWGTCQVTARYWTWSHEFRTKLLWIKLPRECVKHKCQVTAG